MALLLVILLSMILIPFSVEFTYQVMLESRTAINVTDQLMIDNEIDGQYEIVLAHLRHDVAQNETDSTDDEWNSGDLKSRSSSSTDVALTTHMYDELSKLNIRMLADAAPERREIWLQRLRRLLVLVRRDTPFELSTADAETWAANIAQYVRKGPIRANLPTPRMADGRSILVLDELNYLPKVNDQSFEFLLADQKEDDRIAPGLHRYITIYGPGRVNINTADSLLLQAFFPENPEMADRIVEQRDTPTEEESESSDETSTDGDSEMTNAYKEVAEIMTVEGMTQEVLEANGVDPNLDFDVMSDFFSFRILGETKTTRRDELFVVERVRGDDEEQPLEGFRLRLRQERTDPVQVESEE